MARYQGISTKDSAEKFSVKIDYVSPDLESGESISAVTCTQSGGTTSSLLTLVGSAQKTTDSVSQMIEGGKDGIDYDLIFNVTTSAGHIYKDKILVKLDDA